MQEYISIMNAPAPENNTPLLQDLGRGFSCRCPNCGNGKMFARFLKAVDHCAACGERLDHHQADDFPAYVVIVIVGHIMVPVALALEKNFAPPFWVHLAFTMPATLILCLALLQPVKGMIIAIQWRMGMHGFSKRRNNKA